MTARISSIASNTFREAVRDRVLYNLIVFALLMIGTSLLLGMITIGVQRLLLINLGLTAISVFGVFIAIFVGIGLVSKEVEKKTLYTLLTRPVQRWQFIVGKYCGLAGTLLVNTALMAIGFFAALAYAGRPFVHSDIHLLTAIYFIVLQLFIVTAISIFFSSFSTPVLSGVLSFALFVVGTFSEDLRSFAAMASGIVRWVATAIAYVVPNFSAFNVISSVAHGQPVGGKLILLNTLYALFYGAAVVCAAGLIFQRRNLK